MHTLIAHLKSTAPYSQSRPHMVPMLDREIDRDYEERTWRERLHRTEDGHVFIPPTAFKNCLSEAAKFLGLKIPGKSGATYTKHVESGVMVIEPLVLPDVVDRVEGLWLFVPSDGRRGGGRRVWKCFPVIKSWEGQVSFEVLDDILTHEIMLKHLDVAGKFIGVGSFRPRNNSFFGRFSVVETHWD